MAGAALMFVGGGKAGAIATGSASTGVAVTGGVCIAGAGGGASGFTVASAASRST